MATNLRRYIDPQTGEIVDHLGQPIQDPGLAGQAVTAETAPEEIGPTEQVPFKFTQQELNPRAGAVRGVSQRDPRARSAFSGVQPTPSMPAQAEAAEGLDYNDPYSLGKHMGLSKEQVDIAMNPTVQVGKGMHDQTRHSLWGVGHHTSMEKAKTMQNAERWLRKNLREARGGYDPGSSQYKAADTRVTYEFARKYGFDPRQIREMGISNIAGAMDTEYGLRTGRREGNLTPEMATFRTLNALSPENKQNLFEGSRQHLLGHPQFLQGAMYAGHKFDLDRMMKTSDRAGQNVALKRIEDLAETDPGKWSNVAGRIMQVGIPAVMGLMTGAGIAGLPSIMAMGSAGSAIAGAAGGAMTGLGKSFTSGFEGGVTGVAKNVGMGAAGGGILSGAGSILGKAMKGIFGAKEAIGGVGANSAQAARAAGRGAIESVSQPGYMDQFMRAASQHYHPGMTTGMGISSLSPDDLRAVQSVGTGQQGIIGKLTGGADDFSFDSLKRLVQSPTGQAIKTLGKTTIGAVQQADAERAAIDAARAAAVPQAQAARAGIQSQLATRQMASAAPGEQRGIFQRRLPEGAYYDPDMYRQLASGQSEAV